jgi:protein SCO1/2
MTKTNSPGGFPKPIHLWLALALLAGLIAVVGFVFLGNRPAPEGTQTASVAPKGCIDGDLSAFGGPLDLVNKDNARVTEVSFKGHPSILYFGFTYCPDVCPLSMYALGDAMRQLGPAGSDIQTALISVDPVRDTPSIMGQYAATQDFPAGLIGLTGSEEQVAAAARAFRVTADRVRQPGGDPQNYLVNHSSFAYILDADWKVRGIISTTESDPSTIAACVRHILRR